MVSGNQGGSIYINKIWIILVDIFGMSFSVKGGFVCVKIGLVINEER